MSKMLRQGVIELATSEWASPVVLVPKIDGTLRFFRRIPQTQYAYGKGYLPSTPGWRVPRLTR